VTQAVSQRTHPFFTKGGEGLTPAPYSTKSCASKLPSVQLIQLKRPLEVTPIKSDVGSVMYGKTVHNSMFQLLA
jgi:hypothetical protein